MTSNVAPEGWNVTENKEFKLIDGDDDTASECSEYSYFDDYVPDENKKMKKKFKKMLKKEEYISE